VYSCILWTSLGVLHNGRGHLITGIESCAREGGNRRGRLRRFFTNKDSGLYTGVKKVELSLKIYPVHRNSYLVFPSSRIERRAK